MTKLIFKLTGSAVLLFLTVYGGFRTALEENEDRLIQKGEVIKRDMRVEILAHRGEQIALINAVDTKLTTEVSSLKTQVSETNQNVRVLLSRSNREYVWRSPQGDAKEPHGRL